MLVNEQAGWNAANTNLRILSDFDQTLGLWGQQVLEVFVVDLQIGGAEEEFLGRVLEGGGPS